MPGTLIDIRKLFVEESGLYHLVTDYNGGDFTDAGADFYIQAGQRLLDSLQQTRKDIATYQKDITQGDHQVLFKFNRSIERVYAHDGTTRHQLAPRSWNWFKQKINTPVSEWREDTPLYYTRAIIGLAPEQSTLTAGGGSPYTAEFTYDFEDLVLGDTHWDQSGIIFYPKADQTYTMVVKGLWWSRKLDDDTDQNYWSVNHEFILVQAARWAYEAKRRNRTAMDDMLAAIRPHFTGIENARIEEEISNLDELEDPGDYDIEYNVRDLL